MVTFDMERCVKYVAQTLLSRLVGNDLALLGFCLNRYYVDTRDYSLTQPLILRSRVKDQLKSFVIDWECCSFVRSEQSLFLNTWSLLERRHHLSVRVD